MSQGKVKPNSQKTITKKKLIGKPGVSLLLVDLGSPYNIGNIIRTCWVLGGKRVQLFIYDPRNRLEEGRGNIDLSSVALADKDGAYTKVDDLEEFLSSYPGRIIATDVSKQATVLGDFKFQKGDLILLGNENRGYRNENLVEHPGIEQINERLIIPMLGEGHDLPDRGKVIPKEYGKYLNLNVAATVTIVLYAALEQLDCFKDFDFEGFD